GEGRVDAHASTAVGAGSDVDVEHACEELSPGDASRRGVAGLTGGGGCGDQARRAEEGRGGGTRGARQAGERKRSRVGGGGRGAEAVAARGRARARAFTRGASPPLSAWVFAPAGPSHAEACAATRSWRALACCVGRGRRARRGRCRPVQSSGLLVWRGSPVS